MLRTFTCKRCTHIYVCHLRWLLCLFAKPQTLCLLPLALGELRETGAKCQPTDPGGKEEHCGHVAHHSIRTTDTCEAQALYVEGEDLHEGEEAAQIHWPIYLNTETRQMMVRGTVMVPMMPKFCNIDTIMPRAHVVVKRVEAFVVTGEFNK